MKSAAINKIEQQQDEIVAFQVIMQADITFNPVSSFLLALQGGAERAGIRSLMQ